MRTYIHARNVADALLHILDLEDLDTHNAESFNICGQQELDNLAFAWMITRAVQKATGNTSLSLEYEIVDFHSSRPGHDLRYALDGSKLRKLGWTPPKSLEESINKTVKWYIDNPKWLEV
jgi:dTDP-glucose 4,6-dehydratase